LKRLGCEAVPGGLRDYPEGLFNPLGELIEKHLFTSLEGNPCNGDHKESRKKLLLGYFEFAFHHIPLIAAAGRDIAIIRSNDAGESAMITVPRAYCCSSTTLCLPIALAEPAQSFAKRLWLLKVNRDGRAAYSILDKLYLWGLDNPTQCASSIWRRGYIDIKPQRSASIPC